MLASVWTEGFPVWVVVFVLLLCVSGCTLPPADVGESTAPMVTEDAPTSSATVYSPEEIVTDLETAVPKSEDNNPPVLTPIVRSTRADKRQGAPVEMRARLDLAGRLKVLPTEIEIVSVEKTEMPAGSLGCENTESIGQAGLIIGDEVALRVADKTYTYRSDGRQLVPCFPADFPGGRKPAMDGGNRPEQFRLQNLAVNDLATRLGMAKSDINVVIAEHVEWSDASLGCAKPGSMYAQVISPGYRFILEADGVAYEYHTDYARVVLCSTTFDPPESPSLTK
jgi:hypothetical protein